MVRLALKLEGKPVRTTGGRAQFTCEVVAGTLYVTPVATGKPRACGAGTKKMLDHYNKTKSRHLAEYQKLTRNSVYILGLIDILEGRSS